MGIEFNKQLLAISKNNLSKKSLKNTSFHFADAEVYLLPNESNFVFLFNPFDEFILQKFITNNKLVFKNTNSVIAYANDVHKRVLVNNGFEVIFRDQTRKISLHQLI